MNAPPHPADFLNEVLMPATGRSDGEVARLLGMSLTAFYTILTRETPISPATAAMLGRLFNTGEQFWLKMQADYDRFMAPQKVVEMGQAMPVRPMPKPVSEFRPRDVAPWARLMQGNGRRGIG